MEQEIREKLEKLKLDSAQLLANLNATNGAIQILQDLLNPKEVKENEEEKEKK